MKKRVSGLVVLVSLMVLVLGLGSAMAAMVVPYSSSCTADTNTLYDSGDSYAIATDSDSSAQARADGWTLGAKAYVYVDDYFEGGAHAHAEFTQQFRVTAAGAASIDFSYDGWLSATSLGSGTVGGMYDVSFSVNASDDFGNNDGYSYGMSGFFCDFPGGRFSLDYNFLEEEIGNTFGVTLTLNADIAAYEYITYTGDGGVELWSDFYNTAKITGTSGGIEPVGGPPVPIPGALWLLGSGLFGLVAVRRRQGRG